MNPKTDTHLSETEIAQAVADTSLLTVEKSVHLDSCKLCRDAVSRLAGALERMGQVAADGVPIPTYRPDLTLKPIRKSTAGRFGWPTALACATLVLAVSFALVQYLPMSPQKPTPVSTEFAEAETWMTEISALSENALPQVFLDIAGPIEPGINDEFIDFIVPTEEDPNSLGKWSIQKGVA